MKRCVVGKAVLLSAVAWFATVNGQVVPPVASYPYISVTPASPRANVDSITLLLALGSAENSCRAPTFTDVSSTIQQSPLAIYPPMFTVSLSYALVPVPPTKICPDIYAPVDYGPTFGLGKLALGTYNVTDQVTKKQVGSFSVGNVATTLHDTVTVTPQKPTVKDSLHFDLFTLLWDCCTQYFSKTVSVSDTMIVLSFEYSDVNTCECLVAGSHAAFACGPQKAGKYAIYSAPSIYCPAPPCPTLVVIRPVRVGEVVISASSEITSVRNAVSPAGLSIREINNAVHLDCSLSQPGQVTAAVFNAGGVRVAQIYKGAISTGLHGFSWTAAAPGAYFLSVQLNGAPAITRKIVVSR